MSAGTREASRGERSFRVRGCHPLWPIIPDRSARLALDHPRAGRQPRGFASHNSVDATVAALTRQRFRLVPVRSPLLGKSSFLFFPAGTEMFQFPAFAIGPYAFRTDVRGIASARFRIRESPGELARS